MMILAPLCTFKALSIAFLGRVLGEWRNAKAIALLKRQPSRPRSSADL